MRVCLTGLALLVLGASAFGQAAGTLPSPNALKRLSVDQLMDIDVTSVSKRPEKLFEAASAIQVITGDDIRRSGATSLPEALRFASNLEVAQIDSRQWAITARGFNNVFADKMLVLIDGRSVYTPLYAGVYWDVQDTLMEDLDRIEVISGPGSTQWGANAVNGVINITTKSAKDTQGGLLTGTVGTELRDSGGARYGGMIAPGVYYRVYGKYSERGDSVRPNGTAANDAWRMTQGGVRIDADAGAGNALTFQGDVYSGSIGQVGPDDIKVNGNNLLGRWSHTLDKNSDLKLQVYFDRTHRSMPGSFTQDLQTADLDFQHRLPLGTAHDIVWGLGYRVVADDIANTAANAFLPPKVTREWSNIFAQDEITLSKERLMLTLGTKLEHDDYVGFEWEPSARISWTPNPRNTLWAAISRSVRTPSRIDRDLFSPATPPYRIAGGSKVVSEKLIAYEVGYRFEVTKNLVASLATFFSDYDDLRSLEPLTPPLAFPVQANSGLRGRSSGAELTADWQATSLWRLRAGYTEMRVSSEPQPGTPDRGTRDSIARDPNRQMQLRSLLNFYANWEFDSALRYVAPIGSQSLPGLHRTRCPSRLATRARVGNFRARHQSAAQQPRRVQRSQRSPRDPARRASEGGMAFLRQSAPTPHRAANFGRRRMLAFLALAALRLVASGAAPSATPSAEYQVKAVFLFHFAQFVEWPAAAFPTAKSPLVIGILGDDPFGNYIDDVVKNEAIGGHEIILKRYARAEDARGCHILFISRSEADRLTGIVSALATSPTLTASDADDFSQRGGMVRFATEGGKIKLRINVNAAKSRGLSISSKILRAATIVSEAKP